MQEIVLASSNPGKLHEIQQILADCPIRIRAQNEFNLPVILETGLTFIENAILKARHASQHTNLPAVADDSGIVIDALHGEPGIYSARYAGERATDQDNVDKVLAKMQQVPPENRQAHFYCAMVYLCHANDPIPIIGLGIWHGSILFKPQGTNGFGYDPIFLVPTHNCSAAKLPAEIKNHLSHRGQALQQLQKSIFST